MFHKLPSYYVKEGLVEAVEEIRYSTELYDAGIQREGVRIIPITGI